MLPLLYLAAVVAANLSVAHFGPASAPINAFLLIGATLTLRDRIHDQSPRLVPLLILAGALVSTAFGVGRIALASAAAFALSEGADSLAYRQLRDRPWMRRANGSNIVGALVDSIAFPVLAFGGFPLWIIAGQFVAKTAGGALWAWALRPRRTLAAAGALYLLWMAAPAHGQIVAVDVGALRTPASTVTVAEVYAAAPPVLGVRPYAIVSWTPWVEQDAHKPTVVTQVALPLLVGSLGLVTADAGATWYPFLDYKPEPTVGGRVAIFLPARFQVFALVSAEPRNGWGRSYVVGLARTLYRGR